MGAIAHRGRILCYPVALLDLSKVDGKRVLFAGYSVQQMHIQIDGFQMVQILSSYSNN